jgi:hypothetical protein
MALRQASVRAGYTAFLLAAVCLTAGLAAAQSPDSPTITFTLDFPGSTPDHYFIAVSADCRASYDSTSKASSDSDDSETRRSDFTVSPGACKRIFDLAAQTNFFEGEVDSKKKGIASTGAKTLSYKNGAKETKATYNYSRIQSVEQLTSFFQGLSATLEFGAKLEFAYRFQKLALDNILKSMEDEAKANQLAEIQAVAPILQKIVADTSVINIARARAQRLLAGEGK